MMKTPGNVRESKMTELSFLIELLLNHDLPKVTKDLVAARIRTVEERLVAVPNMPSTTSRTMTVHAVSQQAPSTVAAMIRHGELPAATASQLPPIPAPEPVEIIAHTPAAIAALQQRNNAISEALSGRVDKVAGKPKKW